MSRLFQKFKDHVHSSSSASSSQPPIPPLVPTWSKPDSSYTSTQMQRRPSKPDTSVMRVNAVYYPNYRIYRGDHESPATLNYSCITHVFYAFAKVEPDGVVLVCTTFFIKGFIFRCNVAIYSCTRIKACVTSSKTLDPQQEMLILKATAFRRTRRYTDGC